ncbi:MAG: hypothetical protein ABW171_08015 [Steroidobacter sp.]
MLRNRGNALIETIVALLALSPLVAGVVLLGKQLDIKHKTYDALRYSVWERTVWSDGKPSSDLTLEAMDRSFGNPRAGLSTTDELRADGVSRNQLWIQGRRPLLTDRPFAGSHTDSAPPERSGYALVPALAHGAGSMAAVTEGLQLRDLELNDRAFATARLTASVRPVFSEQSQPLTHVAAGAVLSDAWSSRDEREFRGKTDNLTVDELIEALEMPGRPLSMQAPRKGGPLYGEGQYNWDPDLQPRSNVLPSAYVVEREDD